jgi:hypothetical protein
VFQPGTCIDHIEKNIMLIHINCKMHVKCTSPDLIKGEFLYHVIGWQVPLLPDLPKQVSSVLSNSSEAICSKLLIAK